MNVNGTIREALVRCSPIPKLAYVIGLHKLIIGKNINELAREGYRRDYN